MIRNATLDDIPEIVSLWERGGLTPAGSNPDYPKALEHKILAEPQLVMVYEVDSRIVGVIYGIFDSLNSYVRLLTIDEDYRRRGIGSQLLMAMTHRLWEYPTMGVTGFIYTDNTASQNMTRRSGFNQIEKPCLVFYRDK